MARALTPLSASLRPVLPQAPEVQADHAVCSKSRSIISVAAKFRGQPYQLPCAECFLVQHRIIALRIYDYFGMINLKGINVGNCAIGKLCLCPLTLTAHRRSEERRVGKECR